MPKRGPPKSRQTFGGEETERSKAFLPFHGKMSDAQFAATKWQVLPVMVTGESELPT